MRAPAGSLRSEKRCEGWRAERSGGDWALFVCRLGPLDWDQRQRLKTSFEDVFLTCRLLPSPGSAQSSPGFFSFIAREALTHEEAQIGHVCVGISYSESCLHKRGKEKKFEKSV